jgi:hypothetical protein
VARSCAGSWPPARRTACRGVASQIRSAQRRGLKVRRIDDAAERRALVEVANNAEQNHVDPSYRVPTPRNDDLVDHDVWLTVDDPEAQPLLLAVAPRDGEFATLRYFRTSAPATRTATPATSRAARWSPSWRGTACATCSTPRPRPSRPTGCGTSSGWWASATRA